MNLRRPVLEAIASYRIINLGAIRIRRISGENTRKRANNAVI